MTADRLKTKEDALRARDKIRARAVERHKARNKALPVAQRPVEQLWLMTVIFSVTSSCALLGVWRHRSALIGALSHFPNAGSPLLHALLWDLVSVFNALMTPVLIVSSWARAFRARAERRQVREQRRAARDEGVWPPAPRA